MYAHPDTTAATPAAAAVYISSLRGQGERLGAMRQRKQSSRAGSAHSCAGIPRSCSIAILSLASGAAGKSGGGASERVDRLRLRYDFRTHWGECVLNRGVEATM